MDPEKAKNKFQDNPTVVTSKDTIAGGDLNLAVERAKPNKAGPLTKPTKIKWGAGTKDKKQTIQKTSRKRNADAAEENQPAPACSSSSAVVPPPTSTPQNNTSLKPKEISRHTSPETILDTFNSKELTPADWNIMADQKLERGVQRAAEDILKPRDATGEDDDESEEGETSVRRSGRSKKGPSRYGDPIKHSVKLISSQNDILDLNKAALEAYRIELVTIKLDAKNSIESSFEMWKNHLFRRKFGSELLDVNRSWNAEWGVPLQFDEEHEEKEGKLKNPSIETITQKLFKLSILTQMYY